MADINAVDAFGRTALHFAAQSGCLEIVETLISKGAAVNAATLCKETALHFAAEAGHTEIVDLLVWNNCPIDSKSLKFLKEELEEFEEKTALHLATENNHVETVKRLFKFGASLSLKDDYNMTPLQIAAKKGYLEIARELVTSGADINEGNYFLNGLICFEFDTFGYKFSVFKNNY